MTNLFMRNIPANLTEMEIFLELQNLFAHKVKKVKINKTSQHIAIPRTGTITFTSHDIAEEALIKLKPFSVKSHEIQLLWYIKKISPYCNNLVVRGIDKTKTNFEEFYNLFKKFGDIINLKFPTDKDKKTNFGYAYIQYNTEQEYQNAYNNKTEIQTVIGTDKLELSPYVKQEKPKTTLYVNNIEHYNEDDIRAFFSNFGEIVSYFSSLSAQHKKYFLIISYNTTESLEKALKHNGTDICGNKNVFINELQTKEKLRRERLSQTIRALEKIRNEYKEFNLVVGNVPEEMTKEELDRICNSYGNVFSSRFAYLPGQKGVHSSKAYVCFDNMESAERALKEIPSIEVATKKLTVCRYDLSRGNG